MKKSGYGKNILTTILAGITTIFAWHNFLISGNNVIFVFIFISAIFIIKRTMDITNKRMTIVTGILSIVFALIELICKSINYDYTLNHIFDKWILVNLIGYFTIAWSLITNLFYLFEKANLDNEKVKKILDSKIMHFLACALLMLIVWSPIFLRYYPGISTPDSSSQIYQTVGIDKVTDHHPFAHTAIISVFINIGTKLFNSVETGIALYSIFSMCFLATCFSLVLNYLKQIKVPSIVRLVILLWYMFYPINAIYSITMWKDIIFAGIVPLLIIQYIRLIFDTENFLKNKLNIFLCILISVFTIIIRHNGLYMILLSCPFVIIVLRKYWKKVVPLFLAIFIINSVYNFTIYNILKIPKGSIVEMLSIPLQQIARVEKYHRDELNEETMEKINKLFVKENIGDYYNPTLSDDVKWSVDEEYLSNDKKEFISLWLQLLRPYFKDYVESFISNSYGYYYPEAKNWVYSEATMGEKLGIEQHPIIKSDKISEYIGKTSSRDNPVVSMLFSVGFIFWVIIVCLGYKIYKKEYKYILVYLPIGILWLTLIASPVFCEFRYAYPLFTTLPLLISLNFTKKEGIKLNG